MRYPLLYIFIVVFVISYLLILISVYLSDIVVLLSFHDSKESQPSRAILSLCLIFILELFNWDQLVSLNAKNVDNAITMPGPQSWVGNISLNLLKTQNICYTIN